LDLSPLRAAAVPEPIGAIVARCTTKPLTERPQQLSEVCGQIEAYVESLKSARRPPDLPTAHDSNANPRSDAHPQVAGPATWIPGEVPPALRSEAALMLLAAGLVLVLFLAIYTVLAMRHWI
jgi:hypothetical protein